MLFTPIATATIGVTMFVAPVYLMVKGVDLMFNTMKQQPITTIKFKEWTDSKC